MRSHTCVVGADFSRGNDVLYARIAGIMAKEAPTQLISTRKYHHRTQYVRTLEEP